MSERLRKAGELAETTEKKTALVNEDGVAYLVQDVTLVVWSAFEGNTTDEVATKLAQSSGGDPAELTGPVRTIASKLQEVGLLVPVAGG